MAIIGGIPHFQTYPYINNKHWIQQESVTSPTMLGLQDLRRRHGADGTKKKNKRCVTWIVEKKGYPIF